MLDMSKDVSEEYASSLADLTVNSKPLINMLTMLAEDYISHAPSIVMAVEAHLQKVRGEIKLPVLYLIDSIVKNVGKAYIPLFTQNIVSTFCSVFEKVDEKVRAQMFKLRQTWNEVFPSKKLYALDARVNAIDPAWPITATPPKSIHVNPKFLQAAPAAPIPEPAAMQTNLNEGVMREQLLKKQKELLELQKRKVELELMQTKAILEEQQKKLETQTASLKPNTCLMESSNLTLHTQGKPSDVTHGNQPLTNNNHPPLLNIKPTAQIKHNFCGVGPLNAQTAVNSVSLSVRSRDPRIKHKERSTDKRVNALKAAETKQGGVGFDGGASLQDASSVQIQPDGKLKREGRKRKHVPKRRERERVVTDKGSSDMLTDKKTNDARVFEKALKADSKRDGKTEKQHKSRSSDKLMKLSSYEPDTPEAIVKSITDKLIHSATSDKLKKLKEQSNSVKENSDKIKNNVKEVAENDKSKEVELIDLCPDKVRNGLIGENKSHPKVEKRKFPSPSTVELKRLCVKEATPEKEFKRLSKSPSPTATNLRSKSNRRINKLKHQPLETSSPLSGVSASDEPSGKDVDLRLLPSPSKRQSSDSDLSPVAPTKALIDELFGREDVDLRTLPPQPPTPPPPIISSESSDSPRTEKSWANFKPKSDCKSPDEKRSKERKVDQLGRPLLYHFKKEDESDDENSVRQRIPDDCSNVANCNLIIKQAEEQLSIGNITFTQYNKMLKEVIALNEERKLQEAQRKDELESDSKYLLLQTASEDLSEKDTTSSEETRSLSSDQYSSSEIEESKGRGNSQNIGSSTESYHNKADKRVYHEPEPAPYVVETLQEARLRRFQRVIEHDRKYPEYEPTAINPPQPTIGPPIVSRSWMLMPPPPPISQAPLLPPMRNEMPYPRWPHNMHGHGHGHNQHHRPMFDRHDHPPFIYNPGGRPVGRYPMPRDVPPADPMVLDMIEQDSMHTINIDGVPREVRFYGEIAIIMYSWDDPREITFQPGSRRVIINDRDSIILNFNSPYRDYIIDGHRIKVRLGAPTRELYIDGKFYKGTFGGMLPIQFMVGNRYHTIQLEGPPPQVRIGNVKRTDLVAGRINLIVDAKPTVALFLDAKPQRFDIDGIPYILRFVEALQTVVINGRPFKIEFGGLPVPIFFHGVKHFLRLSVLPPGIRPGYISIVNMEGGRLPSPIPSPPIIHALQPMRPTGARDSSPTKGAVEAPPTNQLPKAAPSGSEQPLEVLTSLMPTGLPPSTDQNYTVEPASEEQSTSTSTPPLSSLINVGELYQKLVATGIVPAVTKEKEPTVEDTNTIWPVDFSQPETLKTRQPGLIKRLYTGIQCSSCGVRFSPEETVKYSQHLDWHFRQNRRDRDSTKIAQSRKWYYDVSDWIQYKEIEDLEERAKSWFETAEGKKPNEKETAEEEEPSVVAGTNDQSTYCVICRDKFDQFYNEEKEEWQLRRAIRVDDKVYHPICYEDFKEGELRRQSQPKKLVPPALPIFEEPEELVTIDLDDTIQEDDDGIYDVPTEIDDTQSQSDVSMKLLVEDSNVDEVIEIIEESPRGSAGELPNEPGNLVTGKTEVSTSEPNHSDSSNSQLGNTEANNDVTNLPADSSDPTNPYEDDDILQVEILETKIESYEILDDDDDEEEIIDKENDNSMDKDELETIDFSKVTIKKEKCDIDLPTPVVDTTHTTVTANIDGNVEFEEAPPMVIPGKIKINISRVNHAKANKEKGKETDDIYRMPAPRSTDQASVLALVEQMQPPPPGEELCPAHLKPRLVGVKLREGRPVKKGSELSGLCSLM